MNSLRWRFVVAALLVAFCGSTVDRASRMADASHGVPAPYGWLCLEDVDRHTTNWPDDLTSVGARAATHDASLQACSVEWDEKLDPALPPEPLMPGTFGNAPAGTVSQRHWQDHSAGRTRTPS